MRERSEKPDWALVQVSTLLTGPVPAQGRRNDALMDLAYRSAEAGGSNDEVLDNLCAASDAWDKYPGTYERWIALLGMLRRVRAVYPNGLNGEGWRPE